MNELKDFISQSIREVKNALKENDYTLASPSEGKIDFDIAITKESVDESTTSVKGDVKASIGIRVLSIAEINTNATGQNANSSTINAGTVSHIRFSARPIGTLNEYKKEL